MASKPASDALHRAIYGRTLSGKTFLAKIMAREAKRHGVKLAILDPLADPGWGIGRMDFQTADRDEFKKFIRTHDRRLLIIDETSAALNRFDRDDEWPATMGRHLGHLAIFIAQRPQQISPTVRYQCSKIYCFALGGADAKLLADEWGKPELIDCAKFPVGRFQEVHGFADTRLGHVNFARKNVSWLRSSPTPKRRAKNAA